MFDSKFFGVVRRWFVVLLHERIFTLQMLSTIFYAVFEQVGLAKGVLSARTTIW